MNPLVGTLLLIVGIYGLIMGAIITGILWVAFLDRYEMRRDRKRAIREIDKKDVEFCEKSGIDWKHTAKPPLKARAK